MFRKHSANLAQIIRGGNMEKSFDPTNIWRNMTPLIRQPATF
jgi:hypothetical protein